MRTVTKAIAICSVLCLPLCGPVLAAGPIDGEVSAVWWANDFDTNSEIASTSEDAGAPGLRAELWMLNRYGLRASQFGSDTDGGDGADYTSVDVMWRALSPTENNFVAVGVGWQQMDIDGLDEATSGARITVEGRVSLMGMLYAYGHGSYMPSLSDTDAADPLQGGFEDLDAHEYELGVAWNAMPFMDVHAGYRVNSMSFTQQTVAPLSGPSAGGILPVGGGGSGNAGAVWGGSDDDCVDCSPSAAIIGPNGEAESSGFFVGLGFHF
jgi:hypothetical protein